jgi:RimJ/RimL family protein N-acetyltransferase
VGRVADPDGWADEVVLRDGRRCEVRPITADDASALTAFHARLSAKSIYFRFFAPYPVLTADDVERFTVVDYRDRFAVVVIANDLLVGVARYERMAQTEAEIAFLIEDTYQGAGLGTILLERLAVAASDSGISRLVAEVMPSNTRMIAVFEHAGFTSHQATGDAFLTFEAGVDPLLAMLRSLLSHPGSIEERHE